MKLRAHLPTRLALSCILVMSLGIPAIASASDATAEMLYQEGRRAAQQKDWDVACKKFKESHDREPAPGTLLNLGDCEERRGRLVAAEGHFLAAARLFRVGDERAMYARQRAAGLERRLPKLTLRVHPSSPVGTTIERDGVAVEPGTLNAAIPVDPGEHVLVVRAPGRLDTRSTVRLAESETRELELTPGANVPSDGSKATPAPTPAAAKPAPASMATPPATEKPESAARPLKTLGYVGLGVGAVGIAVGLFAGAKTLSAKHTVDEKCPPSPAPCADQAGISAQEDGKRWSTISTASFVVGALGAAGGVTLLVLSPKASSGNASSVAVQTLASGSQLTWSGSF